MAESSNPRRYEIIDTETGEAVAHPSYILTPTGEEMKPLIEPGWVGPMKGLAVYYHDNDQLHNGTTGAHSFPALKPLALWWVGNEILKELATNIHPKFRKRGLEHIEGLAKAANQLVSQEVEEPSQKTDTR